MGSLVLDKINYAEAKKLQIAQELNLTGNPTWNQIKSAITSMKNSYEADDKAHMLQASKDVNIEWYNTSNVDGGACLIPNGGGANSPIDKIFYLGDRTFCLANKYYEFINGAWTEKRWNTTYAPKLSDMVPTQGIWEDNGVLHYHINSIYSKYDSELDDWVADEETSDLRPIYRCVWHDNDGNTHYDYNGIHKIFNRETRTWDNVTWNVTIDKGEYIWTDGTNIYYSYGENQYVLSSDNSIWNEKDWSIGALSNFDGDQVFYMPKYCMRSSNRETIPFCIVNKNVYTFNYSYNTWKKYKFVFLDETDDALPDYNNIWFWHCRNGNTAFINIITRTSGANPYKYKTWFQIVDTWDAVIGNKNNTTYRLMNN